MADPARGHCTVDISIDDDLLVIRSKISHLLRDRQPSDMVLFYYSWARNSWNGNVLYLATEKSFLADPWARSLPASELQGKMADSRAGNVVVVLDCCHSGIFTESHKGSPIVTARTFDPENGSEGYYVLTATNGTQYALDGQSATKNESISPPQLSHFTSWLVDGLANGKAAPGSHTLRRTSREVLPSTIR